MRKHIALVVMLAGTIALTPSSGSPQEREFSYDLNNPKGPSKWGTIDDGTADCKDESGQQSPIKLSATSETLKWRDTVPLLRDSTSPRSSWQPRYRAMPLKLERGAHTVDVMASGNTATINGTTYDLHAFHFHYPSEHSYQNRKYDMELHLVHKTPGEKKTAVLGIFISADRPTDNPVLEPVFSRLAGTKTEFEGVTINPDDLVKDFRDKVFFHYDGSLTTPPCSTGVSWMILGGVISISPAQLAKYKLTFTHANARPFGKIRAGQSFALCCRIEQGPYFCMDRPGGRVIPCP